MSESCIAIFDIGKTNKKFLLFNKSLHVIHSQETQIPELRDEDGFACENLPQLESWIRQCLRDALNNSDYEIKGVNFAAYGATLVHLGSFGSPIAPVYNYLKSADNELVESFSREMNIGPEVGCEIEGHLNSGYQLYWLKNQKPEVYSRIKTSMHLPQYLSYVFTRKAMSGYSSAGCHTALWDFEKQAYHEWVSNNGIDNLLPEFCSSTETIEAEFEGHELKFGIGIHDSSSALFTFLNQHKEPFLLLSTGTWSVAMNPFSKRNLTKEDIANGYLQYLSPNGKPVLANRVLLGKEHEYQLNVLCQYFGVDADLFNGIEFDRNIWNKLKTDPCDCFEWKHIGEAKRASESLENYSYEEAYHQLVLELVQVAEKQLTALIDTEPINRVYIDGGFAQNQVFVKGLADSLSDMELYVSDEKSGAARGAAMLIYESCFNDSLANDVYSVRRLES